MDILRSDILIIGAGPAGLACALTLARHNYAGSVNVIDCGRDYVERSCLLDRYEQCGGCGGKCNIISGFGGCIYCGDGLKLSGFPSGQRLLRLIGEERAKASMQEAISLFTDEEGTNFHLPCSDSIPFPVKVYPVLCIASDSVHYSIRRFHDRLVNSPQIALHLGTTALTIEPGNETFDVICASDQELDNEAIFRTKKVVVAVGRKGFAWWRQEIRRLRLIHTSPVSSLGLRFECPREYLTQVACLHPDFKTTIYEGGLKFKTFCFCAGSGGGRLRFTDYGPFTLLDGHVVPRPNTSPTANFALLVQLRDESDNPRSFEWIEDNVLTQYRRLNAKCPGKPILQWYPDFKNRTLSCNNVPEFVRLAGFTPSVYDFYIANLATLLPDPIHQAFCGVFERLFTWFCELSQNVNSSSAIEGFLSQVGVMGVELEGLWDEIHVDCSMQSSIKDIYIAGDCAGMAQGILQAMVCGIEVAHHFLENG